jgi:hypothetical protein
MRVRLDAETLAAGGLTIFLVCWRQQGNTHNYGRTLTRRSSEEQVTTGQACAFLYAQQPHARGLIVFDPAASYAAYTAGFLQNEHQYQIKRQPHTFRETRVPRDIVQPGTNGSQLSGTSINLKTAVSP